MDWFFYFSLIFFFFIFFYLFFLKNSFMFCFNGLFFYVNNWLVMNLSLMSLFILNLIFLGGMGVNLDFFSLMTVFFSIFYFGVLNLLLFFIFF